MMPGLPIDWLLLDRYLAGECSDDEVHTVRARADDDPRFAEALQAAQLIRAAGQNPAPRWDLDRTWRNVVRNTAAAQDPVQVRMPTGMRSTWSVLTGRWVPVVAPWSRRIAATVVFALLGGALGIALRHRLTTGPRIYTTRSGEEATVTLADGTRLTLAPESRLRVPASFGLEREVRLDGEAVFTVTHDRRHPFRVRTPQTVTQDVGTTFDVQAYPDAGSTRVIVAEGHVTVGGVSLGAGQLAVVGSDAAGTVVSRVRAEDYLGWTAGALVFDATPVSEVVATVGRWYGIEVRVPDPDLAARHVTSQYKNAPIDEILASLAATLGARVERQGRVVTLVPLHARTAK